MNTGTLYIVSAASGTGKTSLVTELVRTVSNLVTSISYTTREPRSEEKREEHYHFVSQKKFDEMLENGEFVEQAKVFGKSYGTSRLDLEKLLCQGTDIILELDWQGAFQLRHIMPNTQSIFILPPSREALRQRILARNQDASDVIERRLETATSEIVHCTEYDYVIVNDEFQRALSDLKAIVLARRCHQLIQSDELRDLLNDLLA